MEMEVSESISTGEAGVAMPCLSDDTPATQAQGTTHLPGHLLAGFKQVGKAVGLKTDADVASFLIQLFDSIQNGATSDVRCIQCHNFLTLICKGCQISQSFLAANSVKHPGSSSGEGTLNKTDLSKERMVVSSKDMIEYMSDDEDATNLFDMDALEEPAFSQEVCQGESYGKLAAKEMEGAHTETVKRESILNAVGELPSSPAESQLPVPGNCDSAGEEETVHPRCLKNQRASNQLESRAQHDTSSQSEQMSGAAKLGKPATKTGSNTKQFSEMAAKRNTASSHTNLMVNNGTVTEVVAELRNKASLRSERLLQRVNRVQKAQSNGPAASASAPKPASYPCKELGCSEEFSSQAELRNHMKIHNDAAPFRCPECGQRFTVKDNYNEHLRTHYRCDECGVSWIYKRSVERHRKSKHENGGSVLVCPDCGLTFHHKNAYYHHVRQNHVKEHKCEECEMTFSDYIELRRHLEEHYRCDECKVSFSCKSGYKGHMTVKHGAEATAAKPGSVCHICGKNTPNMREHMRFHTGIRPFQCDVCQKTFRTKTVMRRHRFIHTGQRPYQCHLCAANYKDPSGLRAHLLIHGGNRPFKCTNCPKSYTKAYELKLHMRYHTGETPYECPACHKKFRTAGEKEMHVRRKYKTGETPCMGPVYQPRQFSERHRFECPVCGKKFLTSSHLKQHRNRRNKHGMPCLRDPV